jgi:hypothetical protein
MAAESPSSYVFAPAYGDLYRAPIPFLGSYFLFLSLSCGYSIYIY